MEGVYIVKSISNFFLLTVMADEDDEYSIALISTPTKDGVLAAENQGSRLEFAERVLKRKIVRVGSKGLRNVTWKEFEHGDIP